jgi:hypothetical protein
MIHARVIAGRSVAWGVSAGSGMSGQYGPTVRIVLAGLVKPGGRAKGCGMNTRPDPHAVPDPFVPEPRHVRVAGWVLLVTAALSVVIMAMHPTSGTHDHAEFVDRMGRGLPGNTFVHGSLITLLLMMGTCLLWLRDLLGPSRPLVRAGMVALTVGLAGNVVAGLVNGFILPNVAARYVGIDEAGLEAVWPVMALCREVNATAARVGIVGLSLSALLWSCALAGVPGWRRWIGVGGVLCGLTPLAMHAGEHLRVDVPGFRLFVMIYGVWCVLAAIVLVRARPGALDAASTGEPGPRATGGLS